MTFLNPGLLWGLLAVSIPIIIHFFNFRRVKKINFSNISLLKAVNTQAKTFLKLKQWLVLASRILFISCLLMAFFQHFIPEKNDPSQSGRSITSFYVDNSASMQNESDNKSALNIAINKLEKLAQSLPKASKSQLITNDFSSDEFKSFNPAQLKNESSKIEFSGSARSIDEIFERQNNLAQKESSTIANSFFIFSDFQKSTLGNIANLTKEQKSKIYLVPISNQETHNVFVDSVWLDNPFIRRMQANGLKVRLTNSGNKAIKNMPVKLFLGDLQMNSIPTNIEPNSKTTIHFDFSVNQTGYQKGKITFDDNPVIFDNNYYFVLNASPSVRITHLYDGQSPNFYLKNAFSNDSLFKYNTYPLQNVDFGILKNTDTVILEAAEHFNNGTITAITSFLQSGGTIFVVPSHQPDISSYNSIFGKFGLSNFEKSNTPNNELKALAEPKKESDFFRDIFENSKIKDRLLMPNIAEMLKWRTFGQSILQTKGNQNYLTITKANNATVFMLASPLDGTHGNFAENALFVPILYKMASMSIKYSPLAYRFDQNNIILKNKIFNEKTLVKIRKDGQVMIPVQRVVNNEMFVEMPKASELAGNQGLEAGYFELILGNNVERLLALNYSNHESLMEQYTSNELKSIFSKSQNIQVLDQENAADLASTYASETQGKYFWKYFIMAALMFLAFEILIIRFWK